VLEADALGEQAKSSQVVAGDQEVLESLRSNDVLERAHDGSDVLLGGLVLQVVVCCELSHSPVVQIERLSHKSKTTVGVWRHDEFND
jgi:hypothetical protein